MSNTYYILNESTYTTWVQLLGKGGKGEVYLIQGYSDCRYHIDSHPYLCSKSSTHR